VFSGDVELRAVCRVCLLFAIRRKVRCGVCSCSAEFVGVAKNLNRKKQWRDLEDQGGQYPEVRQGWVVHVFKAFFHDFVRSRNTTTVNAWAITDGKLEISKAVSFKTRVTRYTPDMPVIRAHATLTPRSVHL